MKTRETNQSLCLRVKIKEKKSFFFCSLTSFSPCKILNFSLLHNKTMSIHTHVDCWLLPIQLLSLTLVELKKHTHTHTQHFASEAKLAKSTQHTKPLTVFTSFAFWRLVGIEIHCAPKKVKQKLVERKSLAELFACVCCRHQLAFSLSSLFTALLSLCS